LPQIHEGQTAMIDVLYDKTEDNYEKVINPFIDTKNTHGTGCTLSSAIAASLAKGMEGKLPKKRTLVL
jgi:hydroxymethylpyrimidine/phosphomethylpyrimidine kinase